MDSYALDAKIIQSSTSDCLGVNMWINRSASKSLIKLAQSRPALLVTGCRQVGKSSLLQKLFPTHEYVTLDKITHAQAAEENPESYLDSFKQKKTIIDEIQHYFANSK